MKTFSRSEKIKLLKDVIRGRVSLSELAPKKFKIEVGLKKSRLLINGKQVGEEQFWPVFHRNWQPSKSKFKVNIVKRQSSKTVSEFVGFLGNVIIPRGCHRNESIMSE